MKEELDGRRNELDQAQRKGDLARAGELSYGIIPELEKRLKAIEEAAEDHRGMVEEAVTQITSRGSYRVGPAFQSKKCCKAKKKSCFAWKTSSASASSAKPKPCGQYRPPSAAQGPDCKTRTGPSVRSCSSGQRASAKPNCRARLRHFSLTTKTPWSASTCGIYGEALRCPAYRRASRLCRL